MTLTITGTTMTSDHTAHTARQAPGRDGWEVSWLPGQTLDRNTAITAMILADTIGGGDVHEKHRLWPHIQGWAAELGLPGPEALAAASRPPDGIHHDQRPHAPFGLASPRPARMAGVLATRPDPGPQHRPHRHDPR